MACISANPLDGWDALLHALMLLLKVMTFGSNIEAIIVEKISNAICHWQLCSQTEITLLKDTSSASNLRIGMRESRCIANFHCSPGGRTAKKTTHVCTMKTMNHLFGKLVQEWFQYHMYHQNYSIFFNLHHHQSSSPSPSPADPSWWPTKYGIKVSWRSLSTWITNKK